MRERGREERETDRERGRQRQIEIERCYLNERMGIKREVTFKEAADKPGEIKETLRKDKNARTKKKINKLI